jgi:hypothetical protein
MAASRVSRGFHRLGLLLAAIILLLGGSFWVISANQVATYASLHHKALVCAHDFLQRDQKRFWDLSLTKLDNTDEALWVLTDADWRMLAMRVQSALSS